jgi:ribosomal protein S18 acetylase RimI-like enzyme
MPIIRKAAPGDAGALAQLAESSFRNTFGAATTAEDMNLHCRNSYGEAIQAREIANPARVTFLSEDDGRLIGYAQLRWERAPDCVVAKAPGEIQRLYVTGEWHGKGIAQELMTACIDEMKASGADALWLGVWERNLKAMAFYRKFGFTEVGDHVFPVGNDPQRDVIMMRPLTLP